MNLVIMPNIFIIILNWNNAKDTIECLSSLSKVQYPRKKILVIDNGSTDQSLSILKQWIKVQQISDTIELVETGKNLGFSAGNNIGIKKAVEQMADYILLLNNDTVVTESFLSDLIQTASKNSTAGIIGCKIYYLDRKTLVWFNGGIIDYVKGAFYHFDKDTQGQRSSDFITGCLMLIPTVVFRNVGLLDEQYFLNVEDIDFSYRVRRAGYALVVDSNTVIYHKVSSTIGGLYSKIYQYYFHRNRLIFFDKFIQGFPKYIFFIFQLLLAIPLWLVLQILNRRWETIHYAVLGYRDYFRGVRGKASCVS